MTMATYWMTFRLADDAAKRPRYEDRYRALTDAIDKRSSRWWVEATSFILFEFNDNIDTLGAACKAAVNPAWDVVVIRELDKKSAVVVGKAQDQDLFVLMPYAKKL